MTAEQAKAFLQYLVNLIGGGYHPDTPMWEYVDANGALMFEHGTACLLDILSGYATAAIDAAGEDPYGVVLDMVHALDAPVEFDAKFLSWLTRNWNPDATFDVAEMTALQEQWNEEGRG